MVDGFGAIVVSPVRAGNTPILLFLLPGLFFFAVLAVFHCNHPPHLAVRFAQIIP